VVGNVDGLSQIVQSQARYQILVVQIVFCQIQNDQLGGPPGRKKSPSLILTGRCDCRGKEQTSMTLNVMERDNTDIVT
jgi:hypothetical protein